MIMQIFSVYDTASGSFARPMFVASRGVALRVFSDEVNRKADDNMLFNHPEDFQLFHLGSYDDHDGSIKPLEKALRAATASEVKV